MQKAYKLIQINTNKFKIDIIYLIICNNYVIIDIIYNFYILYIKFAWRCFLVFNMEVDRSKKLFTVNASGFFTNQESRDFITEYKTKTREFDPKEFTMIVNGRGLKTSTQDVAEQLKDVMKLYAKDPFKKKILVQQASTVGKMQTQRLCRDIPGFDSMLLVNTLEDALEKI